MWVRWLGVQEPPKSRFFTVKATESRKKITDMCGIAGWRKNFSCSTTAIVGVFFCFVLLGFVRFFIFGQINKNGPTPSLYRHSPLQRNYK